MPKPATSDPARILKTLSRIYTQKPDMDLGNSKDTLIGVLLSARTKDAQVLKIYPAFKRAFPTFASLAKATPAKIAAYISTIGLYKSKAKAIHGLANTIQSQYHGNVPGTMEELLTLPGIGRKSANCVLAYVFGKDTICVDTHVFRIAHRLGWSRGKTPERVEQDLARLIPKKMWSTINRTFVFFGRDICRPGNRPQCWRCPISAGCPYAPKTAERI